MIWDILACLSTQYTLKPESTGLSSLVLGTILKLKRAQGEIILDESNLPPTGADRCCITFSWNDTKATGGGWHTNGMG